MSATAARPAIVAGPARAGPGMAGRLVLIVLALGGVALLFAAAMTRPVTYDEDQYVAAGVFARTMLPYRDFAYLQAPLYPFVLAAAFKLSGGYFLLMARLLTFGLSLLSSVLLWRLLRRLGAGAWLSAVLLAACLTSPFMTAPLGNARNDALPLALMLGGLLAYLWAVERSWWGRALAALLFGLAVEAKVSYLFGAAVLGVHAFGAPGRRLPPFALGMLVAAVPAAVCAWAAPEAFRFGVLDYHLAAPDDWYGREGLSEVLTPPARLVALFEWVAVGGNLTLVVLSAALTVIVMARRRKWKRPGRLLVGLLVGAAAMAFVPSPSWAMYYAAAAPLLACCIAHLWRVTEHSADPLRKRVLVAVAALPVAPVLMMSAPDLLLLRDPGRWVGFEAHRTAVEIRAALPRAGVVATLFPHAVLDANAVPAEFATGPFIFRSGDAWPAPLLERLHALSPATLPAALDGMRPAAIYAGLHGKAWKAPMDQALTRYAESRDWRLMRTYADGGRLWIRP